MRLSIIVPVYNVELYLRRCLDSLVNQDLEDYEIILVNDGSKDNSQAIIDEYKSKYPNKIVCIQKENGGQAQARNVAIKKARGTYLGFVDSDDYVDCKMFKKMYDAARTNNADMVTCNYKINYEDKKIMEDYDLKINRLDMVRENIMKQPAIWNKIVKRKLLIDNNLFFPEGIIYEDYALVPLIAPLAKKIVHVDEFLYYYSVRGNSTMTQTKFNKKFENIITATDFLFKHVKENEIYLKYYSEYEYTIICNLFRDTYLRLKKLSESAYIIDNCIDWMKNNMKTWYKNKYYRANFTFKEKIYNYLIYKKKYNWLGFGK